MVKINKIYASEILDSRGIPTIKTVIELDNGIRAEASVPSGSSAGKSEAKELRDGDDRFLGKGVLKAVSNVNEIIAPKIKGKSVNSQKKIDEILLELDSTPQKSKLGGNTILSVSLAACRLGAELENIALYDYINQNYFSNIETSIHNSFSVVIEAGKHSYLNLDIQEFIIVPVEISGFNEKIRAISEIYQVLGDIITKRNQASNVGLEGAYGPDLKTNTEAMDLIMEAIRKAGYSKKVKLALDVASSEFYIPENEGSYYLKSEEITLKRQQLIGLYDEWCDSYPIISIEDGLEQNDWDGWIEMTKKLSSKNVLTIGDDLFVTNTERIKKGIKLKAATGAIIKPNQIGTVIETIEAIKLARKASLEYIISHRGGDTCDTFIADLAVASGAKFIKTGAPSRGERVIKYNRLLGINQELVSKKK